MKVRWCKEEWWPVWTVDVDPKPQAPDFPGHFPGTTIELSPEEVAEYQAVFHLFKALQRKIKAKVMALK